MRFFFIQQELIDLCRKRAGWINMDMIKYFEQLEHKIHRAINGAPKKQRKLVPTYFEQLEADIKIIEKLPQKANAVGFFVQEVIRFYSIAGTLLNNGFTLDAVSSVSERYLTHILTRSLLENYFIIIYLFDDPLQTSARYEQLKNSFKEDYRKLMNDLNSPSWQCFMQAHQGHLEPADPAWESDPPRCPVRRSNWAPIANAQRPAPRRDNQNKYMYTRSRTWGLP